MERSRVIALVGSTIVILTTLLPWTGTFGSKTPGIEMGAGALNIMFFLIPIMFAITTNPKRHGLSSFPLPLGRGGLMLRLVIVGILFVVSGCDQSREPVASELEPDAGTALVQFTPEMMPEGYQRPWQTLGQEFAATYLEDGARRFRVETSDDTVLQVRLGQTQQNGMRFIRDVPQSMRFEFPLREPIATMSNHLCNRLDKTIIEHTGPKQVVPTVRPAARITSHLPITGQHAGWRWCLREDDADLVVTVQCRVESDSLQLSYARTSLDQCLETGATSSPHPTSAAAGGYWLPSDRATSERKWETDFGRPTRTIDVGMSVLVRKPIAKKPVPGRTRDFEVEFTYVFATVIAVDEDRGGRRLQVTAQNEPFTWYVTEQLAIPLHDPQSGPEPGSLLVTRGLDGQGLSLAIALSDSPRVPVYMAGEQTTLEPGTYHQVDDENPYAVGRRALFIPWIRSRESRDYHNASEPLPVPIGAFPERVAHAGESRVFILMENNQLGWVGHRAMRPLPLFPDVSSGDHVWVLPTTFPSWKETRLDREAYLTPWQVVSVDEVTKQVDLHRFGNPSETRQVPLYEVLPHATWMDIVGLKPRTTIPSRKVLERGVAPYERYFDLMYLPIPPEEPAPGSAATPD